MLETLVPIKLPPGLFRNGTRLDASDRWYDGNLMRWVEGYPQPVGGWRVTHSDIGPFFSDHQYRAMHSWRANSGDQYIVAGSNMELRVIFLTGTSQLSTSSDLTEGRTDAVLISGQSTFGIDEADSWQFDNFGDFLVAVLSSDGRLLQWNPNTIGGLTTTTGAPTSNIGVVVTPERFAVCLGAGGVLRKVQWSDQEVLTTWTPSVSNQAGDFTLQTNGRLMCGKRAKAQTLLWTDADMWSMNYIGGELVYGFQQEGEACGIISKHAAVVVDTQAFWMGRNNFFKYDGFVQPIPCEVRDYVFEDFNTTQVSKIWGMSLAEFTEVWWFYVSEAATEIDRYVAYNYRSGHWHFGNMVRTAGIDAGVTPLPMMVGPVGSVHTMFEHEIGEDRGSEVPYLESGPITLDKDRVMRIQRIVPDESVLGDAKISIYTSMFPTATETLNGPYTLTNPTDVRLSAKHIRVRVQQNVETSWRVGTTQLGVIPLGRR